MAKAKMTKANLVALVSAELRVSNDEGRKAVDTVLQAIDVLTGPAPLVIAGFGRFEKKQFKARTARHPRTGESYPVPAFRKLTFSASKGEK